MDEFRFVEYNTEYSCKGELNQQMGKRACFGYVFDELYESMSIQYEIIIYKNIDFCVEEKLSNACFLNKEQLRNHIKQAKGIYDFKYSIKEIDDWNGYKVFKVILTLKKLPEGFHKYLLTWLRYTYEFPYNMLLQDAYKLKVLPSFRFTSIANLFNITLAGYWDWDLRTIHQIPDKVISKPMTKKEIHKKLKKLRILNELYLALTDKTSLIPEKVDEYTSFDLEYWTNDKIYEQYRKPVYLDIYKTIRKK